MYRERRDGMKEFIEEYGGIIAISLMGYAVMSGLWEILRSICQVSG